MALTRNQAIFSAEFGQSKREREMGAQIVALLDKLAEVNDAFTSLISDLVIARNDPAAAELARERKMNEEMSK
jgi:hypothetical protein